MDPRIRFNRSAKDLEFLSTLLPSRRAEIEAYLAKYDSNIDDLIDDPDIKTAFQKVRSGVDEDIVFLNVAGKGYRKAGDELTTGQEKGRIQLVPDKPVIYTEEEQDLGELINLQKEYDFQMSGKRNQRDAAAQSFFARKLDEVLNTRITTASRRNTGMGGVASDPKRKNHPDLPEITLDNTLPATSKFMRSNLMGNEIGAQSITENDRKGNPRALPIEHTMVPFSADPSRGMDVSNRDLGSPVNNSVLRGETDTDRIAELLYHKIADKAEYIANTYGVSAEDLMKEYNMVYQIGQPTWDSNKYSGIKN